MTVTSYDQSQPRDFRARTLDPAQRIGNISSQPISLSLHSFISRVEPNKTRRGFSWFKNLLFSSLGKFLQIFQSRRYTVYVLQCEHKKYYVGNTKNRKRRMKEHMSEHGGSKWTRQHPPLQLLKAYRRIPHACYLGKPFLFIM
jgi:hypothetical protein